MERTFRNQLFWYTYAEMRLYGTIQFQKNLDPTFEVSSDQYSHLHDLEMLLSLREYKEECKTKGELFLFDEDIKSLETDIDDYNKKLNISS